MKILYFGAGYVGTCSAAVNADSGHEVLVYDINQELIKKLSSFDKDTIESSLFEKGLGDLIVRNQTRIKFSHEFAEIEQFIDEVGAVFMCLPTPEKDSSGETDLSYYDKAARDLSKILVKRNSGEQNRYVLIVNKSTLPIEMVDKTKEILDSLGVKNYGAGSNPEFLVEGDAVEGSIRPPRIVVGAWTEKDFAIFREIYNRFVDAPNVAYLEVNPREAAAGKLLANYILFNRLVNCFDVAGRVSEKFSKIHYENLRKILISDSRIGDWGFYNSLYAGGSCFIKDARSLAHQLKNKNSATDLISDTLTANQRQLENFFMRAQTELNFSWQGKRAGLLGLAFKRDTNDIRNSSALGVTEFLFKAGIEQIKAYDPIAGSNYLKYFSGHDHFKKIILADSEIKAMSNVDALIIATDWPQFRGLPELIKDYLTKGSLIMDGRRMLQYKYYDLANLGYNIIAVGSPLIKAKN